MKTAKKYLEDLQSKGGELADVIEDNKDELIMLLKNYAKQVSEQALLDASENAIMYCIDREPEGVDKDSILNTNIQLP